MKKKYKVAKYLNGGPDTDTLTNQHRSDWNTYVDWLRTKKIAGDPSLDTNELGFKYLDQYVKENPNTSLRRDLITPLQQDLQQYRGYALNNIKSGKSVFAEGVNESNFMNHLSKVDGYPGQYTTSVKFPYEYMRYVDHQKGTDQTINKGFAGQRPYGGGVLTAEGAKEILRDGKVRGKKLTDKQKRYFGYIAGGGKPKSQYGIGDPIDNLGGNSAFGYKNDGVFMNPTCGETNSTLTQNGQTYYKTPDDQKLKNVPTFTPAGPQEKNQFEYGIGTNPIVDLINNLAIGTTVLANQRNSKRDFRNEQRKYYQELQQPTHDSNYTVNSNPIYSKYGVDVPQDAKVEAEGGEVYQDEQGNVVKIDNSAPSHEQGGVPLANVQKVLEDTSTTRKDEMSQALKITPTEFEGMFGFKTDRSVSHSKAMELADKYFSKKEAKYNRSINRSLDTLKDNKDDIYATASVMLNGKYVQDCPKKDEVFNYLFDHQEQLKSSMDMNNQPKAKYGFDDPNDPYKKSKTTAGHITDTGASSLYNIPDGLQGLNRIWKRVAGIDGDKLSNKEFQSKTYDWLLKNNPDVLHKMWEQYGNTNRGKNTGTGRNFDFKNLTTKQLADLKNAYVDGDLGARTLLPPQGAPIDITKPDLSYNLPVPNGNPSNFPVPNNPPTTDVVPPTTYNKPQPQNPSRFNEPLNWWDTAGPLMTLASSERIPAKYNPVQLNEVRLKLQNPEPSLAAGQRQYNQAVSMLPDNAAGQSNVADVYAAKYASDNQVLGNYENINSQIKNQEVLYNAGVRDKQSVADAQSRQTFEQQYLGSKEAERQQKLSAFDDLFTRIALNRKLNREGDLIQQMFPNYNQYGRYNGNQRYLTTGTDAGDIGGTGGVNFKIFYDQSGKAYRMAQDASGKWIPSSKMIPDNKSIGSGK